MVAAIIKQGDTVLATQRGYGEFEGGWEFPGGKIGQFLDDFSHARDKAALIADEPQWDLDQAGRWYYDLAATAHKLANDNGLAVPPMVP